MIRNRPSRALRTPLCRTLLTFVCLTVAALAVPYRAAAQAPPASALLPDTAAIRIVEFYNHDATTRLSGDAHLSAATATRGGVAVLGGTLIIEGVVEGDVVVINGDLVIRGPNARVDGAVTVSGGQVSIDRRDAVTGAILIYREPLRYRVLEGRLVYVPASQERGLSAGVDLPFGRTDLFVAIHGAYNRVEGLPIAIGPRVRFGGAYPLSARALLIARTAGASSGEADRFGYDVRVEQLASRTAGLNVGISLYSEVVPIERSGMSDRESSLAALLLRQDFRDHYEREGWSIYGRIARPGSSYSVQLTYRDEEHVALVAADPFTLFYPSRAWRLQPRVAEGPLRSIAAAGRFDTRNEERDPSTGWLIDAEVDQGLGGSLDREPLGAPAPTGARSGYRTASVDARRYARFSPYARLALRVYGEGSLDARALPPQRQHALGGEGTLPGYRLFQFDCGARASTVELRGQTYYPYYGCDQILMVQLEYQAAFPFARRLTEELGLSGRFGQLVRWVAFFDAGRAWIEPDGRDGRAGGSEDFSADAGIGLRLGPLGAYWAFPLSGSGRDVNFFVRLGPRL
jgi:cytoskeletal protein CcmA (bactofilin family)